MSMSSNDVDMARKKRARHELGGGGGGGGGCAEVLDISIGSVQFAEPFNADALAYVVAHWAEVMDKSADDGKKLLPPKRMAELYLSACGAGAGNVAVTYTQNGGRGRWYAAKSRSMQGMKRAVRHVAAAGLYVDVDCVNCYGCVLQWLCAEHALPCPQLDLYVAQRDVLLADLMAKQNGRATSRDYAKKVYIAVMNGGAKDYDGLVCRPEHLQLFQKEMQRLGARLAALFPQRLEQVKARRVAKGKAAAGRADPHICAALMMDLYFEKENEVLECMWRWFGAPTDCVLCFDGIMLSAAHGPYDEQVLAKCEAHVKETTGISMKLKTKPFDEGAALPADVTGSLQQYLRPKPFLRARLRQLVDACSLEALSLPDACGEMPASATDAKAQRTAAKAWTAAVQKVYCVRMQAAVEYFGTYHAMVRTTPHMYVHVDYGKVDGRMSVAHRCKSERAFIQMWRSFTAHNPLVSKVPDALNVAKLWLRSRLMRVYDALTYEPNVACPYVHDHGPNLFNTWTGWCFEQEADFEIDAQLIRRVTGHLREIICDGDAEMYAYVLKLWKLVLLGKKTGVTMCLSGLQGSGKNCAVEYFGKMIVGPSYYTYYNNLDDLTGRFTSMRVDKSFVVCDEMGAYAGDHKTARQLKGLITQESSKRELKGVDAGNAPDYCNFVFLSNNENFVKVEGRGDRRYCVMKVSNAKKGDTAYFRALHWDMGNAPRDGPVSEAQAAHAHEVGKHFFHLLLQQDVSAFNAEAFPRTALRKEMEKAATPPLAVFVYWFFCQYLRLSKTDAEAEAEAKTEAEAQEDALDMARRTTADEEEDSADEEEEEEVEMARCAAADDEAARKTAQHTRVLASKFKGVRISSAAVFDDYVHVLAALGMAAPFGSTATLMRRLKKDYPAFGAGMRHGKHGNYFSASDLQSVRDCIHGLETHYRFDEDVATIRRQEDSEWD
jgi:hypothetical protein